MRVRRFDCGNEVMNRDLTKALKHEDFPEIQLNLLGLKGRINQVSVGVIEGDIRVKIAGADHRMFTRCTVESLPDGKKKIIGSQLMRFSDFDIRPPRKMLGVIRVEDEIEVDFSLVIKEEDG